jgi:hypothetical protein
MNDGGDEKREENGPFRQDHFERGGEIHRSLPVANAFRGKLELLERAGNRGYAHDYW